MSQSDKVPQTGDQGKDGRVTVMFDEDMSFL